MSARNYDELEQIQTEIVNLRDRLARLRPPSGGQLAWRALGDAVEYIETALNSRNVAGNEQAEGRS